MVQNTPEDSVLAYMMKRKAQKHHQKDMTIQNYATP